MNKDFLFIEREKSTEAGQKVTSHRDDDKQLIGTYLFNTFKLHVRSLNCFSKKSLLNLQPEVPFSWVFPVPLTLRACLKE